MNRVEYATRESPDLLRDKSASNPPPPMVALALNIVVLTFVLPCTTVTTQFMVIYYRVVYMNSTSREVNEARRPHTCSRPCAFQRKKTKKKSRRTQNTPRNPQQSSDRDHLEAACDETRPTRSPTLARFIDLGFVQIGLVPLSSSVKTTNVTHTHRQTN